MNRPEHEAGLLTAKFRPHQRFSLGRTCEATRQRTNGDDDAEEGERERHKRPTRDAETPTRKMAFTVPTTTADNIQIKTLCLALPFLELPSPQEYQNLMRTGLGARRWAIPLHTTSVEFRRVLCQIYPRLDSMDFTLWLLRGPGDNRPERLPYQINAPWTISQYIGSKSISLVIVPKVNLMTRTGPTAATRCAICYSTDVSELFDVNVPIDVPGVGMMSIAEAFNSVPDIGELEPGGDVCGGCKRRVQELVLAEMTMRRSKARLFAMYIDGISSTSTSSSTTPKENKIRQPWKKRHRDIMMSDLPFSAKRLHVPAPNGKRTGNGSSDESGYSSNSTVQGEPSPCPSSATSVVTSQPNESLSMY